MLGDNIRQRESGTHSGPGEDHHEEAWRDATQAINGRSLECLQNSPCYVPNVTLHSRKLAGSSEREQASGVSLVTLGITSSALIVANDIGTNLFTSK